MAKSITPEVRDWQARTANTVLTYLFGVLCIAGMVISILVPFCSAPLQPRKGDMETAKANRFVVANAVLDGVTIIYLIFFLVTNRYKSARPTPVWVHLIALAVIFGWNIGMSIPLEAAQDYYAWYFLAGALNWAKSGVTLILFCFIAIYTSIVHGRAGWKQPLGPQAQQAQETMAAGAADSSISRDRRDRGAQIALKVLLSFLELYTVGIFGWGLFELDGSYFERYNARPNPPHIITLVLLPIFFFYVLAWFLGCSNLPSSPLVSTRTTVIVFTTMVVLIGTLSGVSMYLGTLEKPIYNSGMTPIFTLVWAGYLIVIMIFMAIYTRVHHKDGGWRRRFATSAAALEAHDAKVQREDVELAETISERRRLSDASKAEREETPALPY